MPVLRTTKNKGNPISDDLQSRRDQIAEDYFETLTFDLYPVQEEALLAWFTEEQGVLVCAPTGTGKTLIAEAAIFEALQLGKTAYYTTPLIALTDQKFRELQETVVRWGYSADDVGLVTGNRKVNPQAKVLVVVAEILLNRLLHHEAFDFSDVWAVVMDEFHSFNDLERGIVWEFGLSLLPRQVKTLLLSATVGNALEFTNWLHRVHQRDLKLVSSDDRKVPLSYTWVEDELLPDQIEKMVTDDDETRLTPALLFCFNREQCWTMAEMLKGKKVVSSDQQKQLSARLNEYDWSQGAGPKLKQILIRGVGVHHAGVLPRYRQIVEDLFQEKLLSVCVCTETLAAGINLPARSVVLPTLLKGPRGKMKVIEPSSAKQMFGRAGRPQFDSEGYVYAIAHEDDVKIARYMVKFDQIPENTKDPNLIRAKKRLKKKMPTRRKTEQYWSEPQFDKLVAAPPGKLASRGGLPWRLLAYLLTISPEVSRLQKFIGKRLLEPQRVEHAERQLTQMLLTLEAGGYIRLEPEPPRAEVSNSVSPDAKSPEPSAPAEKKPTGGIGALIQQARTDNTPKKRGPSKIPGFSAPDAEDDGPNFYQPEFAHPAADMHKLLGFRSVNPLYGVFLIQHLGIADPDERIQLLESVLNMPGTIQRLVRVPKPEVMPPGTLARERIDQQLIDRGIATQEELYPQRSEERPQFFEERLFAPPLAEKVRTLFDNEFPRVSNLFTRAVWCAGDLLSFGGDFNAYIGGRSLARQEGMIFRHLLRLVLVCEEFAQVCPPELTEEEWQSDLREIADRLTESCRNIDPESTDKAIEAAHNQSDIVAGETAADSPPTDSPPPV
jgi:superfamily II DNA/RNA helicase